jgi:hypothetical protein
MAKDDDDADCTSLPPEPPQRILSFLASPEFMATARWLLATPLPPTFQSQCGRCAARGSRSSTSSAARILGPRGYGTVWCPRAAVAAETHSYVVLHRSSASPGTCTRLVELRLGDMPVDHGALATFVTQNRSSLRVIVLTGCYTLSGHAVVLLATCDCLVDINLRGCHGVPAPALAAIVASCPTIERCV